MATSLQEILRVPRTDSRSEHLLLNISKKGPKSLDLELVGTDRDSIYCGTIKDTSVKDFQATNFAGDLDQWKAVLSHALLHQTPDGPLPESLQGVEAVAAIRDGTVTLTLRKNIDGITQRLGTIQLKKDEDREIDTLEWVDAAAKTSDNLRARLQHLQDLVTSQQDQIVQLTASLDSLVRAKKEHEDELLSKFAALLNAKKLKIRDQQRLLAGAHVDADAGQRARSARSESTQPDARAATASRQGKRKANARPPEDPVEDENDDQTDAATLDEEDEDRRRQETPETEDEDVAEDDLPVVSDASGMTVEPDHSQRPRRVMKAGQNQPDPDQMDIDSTRRATRSQDVPLRNSRTRDKDIAKQPTPPPTSTVNEDGDDETEDDEL